MFLTRKKGKGKKHKVDQKSLPTKIYPANFEFNVKLIKLVFSYIYLKKKNRWKEIVDPSYTERKKIEYKQTWHGEISITNEQSTDRIKQPR